MGGPIFLIRSDIHRVRDGARVDPPGVIFWLPEPQYAATAHTYPNRISISLKTKSCEVLDIPDFDTTTGRD